jgi:hypothetical protein
MTIAICHGCGRRASSEEVHCAACGRPLVEGDVTPPLGWMTADELGDEPLVRPEPAPPQTAELSAEETAALFVPAAARGRDAGEVAADPALHEVRDGDEPALAATSSIPGGHGWRVRVSAANAARVAAAGESDAVLAGSRGPRRLPGWVYAALVIAILSTSAAAVVLIVIHVMHQN